MKYLYLRAPPNMQQEGDPVSTTIDLGLNNNQLPRDRVSRDVSEEYYTEDDVYNSDGADELHGFYDGLDLRWSLRRPSPFEDADSENRENFWTDEDSPDDNELNNNDAVFHDVAGDSVNRLDTSRDNEEKIFYEKPKLNIQTVTHLYDTVLPPTEKCMNYVNSINSSDIPDNAKISENSSPQTPKTTEISSFPETPENSKIPPNVVKKTHPKPETIPKSSDSHSNDPNLEIDVEIVELTKSFKETLQFPEIEDISDSAKTSETNDSQTDENFIDVLNHIDLIKEAKKLSSITEKSPKNKNNNDNENDNVNNNKIFEKNSSIENLSFSEKTGIIESSEISFDETSNYVKIEEIDLLSSIGRDIGVDLEKYVQPIPDIVAMDSLGCQLPRGLPTAMIKETLRQDTNKLVDREPLPDVSSADTRKKEKMARNQARRRQQSHNVSGQNRRPDKRRADHIADGGPGGFDVYNIETAMPKIDLDAIESHLRAAREEERREEDRVAEVVEAVAGGREPDACNRDKGDLLARFNRLLEGDPNVSDQRRNDREEIRRRLAMGPDADDLRAERGRKPSLQSRLQSGMNLQICFMNETPSDTESPGSENDSSSGSVGLSSMSKFQHKNAHQLASRPQVLSLPPLRVETGSTSGPLDEADFFARQARLQTEARMALAQAKEMAHMQMEVERQRLKQSPITEMVRSSLEKVGVQLGEDRRRLSRLLLTELNVAQLQVIANDLHARIAMLNEALVEGLLRRDDLHMEQDSMLVDVEDLTRYLGAKQESPKKPPRLRELHQQQPQQQHHHHHHPHHHHHHHQRHRRSQQLHHRQPQQQQRDPENPTSQSPETRQSTTEHFSLFRKKLLNSLGNRRAA